MTPGSGLDCEAEAGSESSRVSSTQIRVSPIVISEPAGTTASRIRTLPICTPFAHLIGTVFHRELKRTLPGRGLLTGLLMQDHLFLLGLLRRVGRYLARVAVHDRAGHYGECDRSRIMWRNRLSYVGRARARFISEIAENSKRRIKARILIEGRRGGQLAR